MNMFKSNKNKKIYSLLFLFFGMILANYSSPLLNLLIIDNSNKNDEEINYDNPLDFQNQTLETSDALTSFNGFGDNVNISLHQSIIQTGLPLFEISNASDYDNNTFSIISPSEQTFSSTLSEISVEDLYAPNASLIVEDYSNPHDDFAFTNSNPAATSFIVKGDGYLENATFFCRNNHATNTATVKVVIYNSTWIGTRSEPDLDSETDLDTFDIPGALTGGGRAWRNISNQHYFLDNSKTENNTWFIGLYDTSSGNGAWSYVDDSNAGGGNTDSNDETWSYENPTGVAWNLIVSSSFCPSVDLELIVDLSPIDNVPLPTEIDLRINGTEAWGNVKGSGNWNSSKKFSILTNQLDFELTAGWWNVSCNITKIQVNYTKTDLSASAEFIIAESDQIVEWNVTRTGGLNYFDSRFDNYQINFTIPDTWYEDTIRVFNGGVPKTSDSTNRSLGNGYREVNVFNAGNGTFWHLKANSTNLLYSIDTYVSGVAMSIANHSNIVELNATFNEIIKNGDLNLSVYSPLMQYLNHSKILSISSADTEFLVSNWDVSVNVTQYGIFKIQMSWNNDTAAGFLESNITIFGDTDLIPSLPLTNFDASNTFNITVYFNDTGLDTGIVADLFTYNIEGGSTRTDNVFDLGNGYYNITIDCNDTDFNGYGPKNIEISASKQYYNNQTKTVQITIYGETELTILNPPDLTVFNSGDTFNVTVLYNDTVKNQGIDGAIIEYQLDPSASYKSINIVPLGSGKYNITIDCNDGDFIGYGLNTIIVNASKQNYYNQSNSININILGETSLSATRIPDQSYYTAAETFSISVYYRNTVKSLGITGAEVVVDVDGTIYNPVWTDNADGYYNITIDCSDSIFSNYKLFSIRVNVSLVNYHNQSTTLNTLIVGNETLFVLAPTSGAVYIEGQNFDVTVEYNDTIKDVGIDGATIEYSLDEGSTYRQDNVNYIGDGKYNININVNDTDFIKYGFVDIFIDASKQFYENRSTTYTFHRQITTQITPFNIIDLGSVMKGLNVSYTFNYTDTNDKPIEEVSWSRLSSPVGFTAFLENLGNGNYTMHLDTTNVLVTGSAYDYEFNVYATGNETQIIRLTVNVLTIQTEVIDVFSIPEIARNSGLNQSVRFYFNDTTNNLPVLNVITENIVVKNYATGTPFSDGEFWLFDPFSNGTYILDITMGTRNSGLYTLEINASKFPNYDYSLFNVTFYYRGNYTQINLISLEDPGGELTPSGLGYNFTIFEESDLDIEFNITDLEFSNNLVLGAVNSYYITYINLDTSSNGTLLYDINFITNRHIGTISTSNINLVAGRYLINITVSKTNYENTSFIFNLTVIEKYQTRLTVVLKPTEVNAGDLFSIVLLAEFYNGSDWLILQGNTVIMTPYFDGTASTEIQTKITNSTGGVSFDITIRSDARTMNISLELQVEYDHLAYILPISDIDVIPLGLAFEELLPYIILIGAIVAVAGGSLAVYRGVVVPKKREKQRILTDVKTIFDDAINLEHILVLYKGTGTCIFFKSYGSEQIDPELIGGFLTAVSSFGKEMATQETLNEISYGDKMLLLADGQYIRVALVLGKKASMILRRHLKEFIDSFEKTYKEVLPTWRGQLNHFRNAGIIVDEILNTSIILPHQISYDFSSVKELKGSFSKDVLKIAHSCCEEAEREFFFVATLLKEASEKTSKDTAEIFMGIKELRDKKILMPIEISTIEAQPISQQELNLISQKVASLTTLTNNERQKLVNDLGQLGPIEREAYLSSLTKQHEIVSAPIKTTIGTIIVDNKKSAKKGVNELSKRAKIAKGKKNYQKTIELYQSAAMLASNWELSNEFVQIEEIIRKTKIEDLSGKKKDLEKEAKDAVKNKNYAEASARYKYASKMASEIFKLGASDMTKEVKRLTKKANEYEKLK